MRAARRARGRDHIPAVALTLLLLAYLSWQLTGWLPGSRRAAGDLLLLPVDLAATAAAWWASLRLPRSTRERSVWRIIAFALACETVGDLVQTIYDVGPGGSPFPSLADPFYLAFYPLLLLALVRIPVRGRSRGERAKTILDAATIVVGGGAVVWYLVLGPAALEGGQSTLARSVSLAFPIGDLFLIAGLAVLLLRESPDTIRSSLKLVTVALALGIAADVLYGAGQLHGTYAPGDAIDTLYALEFSVFALAGVRQARAGGEERSRAGAGDPPRAVEARPSWIPNLSVAIGLGVLLVVKSGGPLFPDVSLIVIVIVLTGLVAVRQYVAQRELLQTQAALRRSELAKDEFLSVVGHELRTPLTSIRGSLGLLDGGILGELPEDAANMVAVAVLNADRLTRIVNDVLDVERMAAGLLSVEPAVVSASDLVEQALQVVAATADAAGVSLHGDVADVEVLADSDRIVQALVNLLGNAVKFSERGGAVSVSVSEGESRALFSVRDHGRGIPAEELETIFERFRQVDASDAREKGGAGLGLPIARGIVEQHGGRMWAESERTDGSTLRFTLPLAVERDAAEMPRRVDGLVTA